MAAYEMSSVGRIEADIDVLGASERIGRGDSVSRDSGEIERQHRQ